MKLRSKLKSSVCVRVCVCYLGCRREGCGLHEVYSFLQEMDDINTLSPQQPHSLKTGKTQNVTLCTGSVCLSASTSVCVCVALTDLKASQLL